MAYPWAYPLAWARHYNISMFITLSPLPAALDSLVGGLGVAHLPGGPYQLPATLHPMLVFVGRGEVRRVGGVGGDPTQGERLPAISLCGGTTRFCPAWAPPGTEIHVVSLRAGQLPRLLGLSAWEVLERWVSLSSLVPDCLPAAIAGGPLAVLADRLAAGQGGAPVAGAIADLLLALAWYHGHRPADLALPGDWLFRPLPELARATGLGERRFQRHFQHSTGQSLRSYRQQWRCTRLLVNTAFGRGDPGASLLTPTPALGWADAAAEGGYVDQAHLHRDFLRYTGHTPGRFSRALGVGDQALWPYRLSPGQVGRLLGEDWFPGGNLG